MAPLFDLCHYLLAALAVRADGGLGRSRSHPLATWLATMSASFAGSLLANPLLGKPVLAAVSNEYQVLDGNFRMDLKYFLKGFKIRKKYFWNESKYF